MTINKCIIFIFLLMGAGCGPYIEEIASPENDFDQFSTPEENIPFVDISDLCDRSYDRKELEKNIQVCTKKAFEKIDSLNDAKICLQKYKKYSFFRSRSCNETEEEYKKKKSEVEKREFELKNKIKNLEKLVKENELKEQEQRKKQEAERKKRCEYMNSKISDLDKQQIELSYDCKTAYYKGKPEEIKLKAEISGHSEVGYGYGCVFGFELDNSTGKYLANPVYDGFITSSRMVLSLLFFKDYNTSKMEALKSKYEFLNLEWQYQSSSAYTGDYFYINLDENKNMISNYVGVVDERSNDTSEEDHKKLIEKTKKSQLFNNLRVAGIKDSEGRVFVGRSISGQVYMTLAGYCQLTNFDNKELSAHNANSLINDLLLISK